MQKELRRSLLYKRINTQASSLLPSDMPRYGLANSADFSNIHALSRSSASPKYELVWLQADEAAGSLTSRRSVHALAGA